MKYKFIGQHYGQYIFPVCKLKDAACSNLQNWTFHYIEVCILKPGY